RRDCKTAEAHRLSGLSTDLSTHSAERGGTRCHASQELRDGTADQTGFPATRRYQGSWRPANSKTVEPPGSVGSNPTPSAQVKLDARRGGPTGPLDPFHGKERAESRKRIR